MADAPSPTVDTPSSSLLTEAIRTQVGFHAKNVARRYGLSDHDREDLEQDLSLDVLHALRRYDASRSRTSTFCEGVLRLASKYRARQIRSRRGQPVVAASRRTLEAFEDPRAMGFVAEVDQRLDLTDALLGLPGPMRHLADELAHRSPHEIARRTGAHRATVYRRIARLRTALAFLDLSLGTTRDRSLRPADI